MVTASDDFSVKIFDLHTYKCIDSIEDYKFKITSIFISKTDELYIGYEDQTVKILLLNALKFKNSGDIMNFIDYPEIPTDSFITSK